jgi:hypothetical protein
MAGESLARYFNFYNTRRPHRSLDGMTPDQAYFAQQQLPAAALPNAEASLKEPGKLFRRTGPALHWPCLKESKDDIIHSVDAQRHS